MLARLSFHSEASDCLEQGTVYCTVLQCPLEIPGISLG